MIQKQTMEPLIMNMISTAGLKKSVTALETVPSIHTIRMTLWQKKKAVTVSTPRTVMMSVVSFLP